MDARPRSSPFRRIRETLGLAPRPTRPAPRRRARPGLDSLESRELLTLSPSNSSAIVELKATFPDHQVKVGSGVPVEEPRSTRMPHQPVLGMYRET